MELNKLVGSLIRLISNAYSLESGTKIKFVAKTVYF